MRPSRRLPGCHQLLPSPSAITIRGYRHTLVRAIASDNDRAWGMQRRLLSGLITNKHKAQQITAELAAIVRRVRSAEAGRAAPPPGSSPRC